MRVHAVVGLTVATLALGTPAIATPQPQPILTNGMSGAAVKRVQKALDVTPRSGYFGPVTTKAVKRFQRKRSLPVTGVVGPKTWRALTKGQKKKVKSKKASTPAPTAMTVQFGDRGAAVLFLQEQLGVTPATGYFGPITQSYVKALQAAAGLPVTGIADGPTWAKVGKVTFTPPATTAPAAPSSTAPLPAPASATAAKVLAVAASQAGVPYVANGYSPEQGFNCSSYTQWVYQQVGIDLGGAYTVWQYDKARKISAAEAKPGDLVFFYNYANNFIGHVGIYAGNGMMWHAPRTGRVVSLEKVYTDKVYYGRVLAQ